MCAPMCGIRIISFANWFGTRFAGTSCGRAYTEIGMRVSILDETPRATKSSAGRTLRKEIALMPGREYESCVIAK